ncbi:MAG: tetratricopeptide repeat protein [Victivallales bacterium]|nr:tetratricopeptide repeat protein [Victivallales bacterium]
MKRISKTRFFVSLIIFAAVCLRLLYLYQYASSPLFSIPTGPDVEEYDNWAREILAWGFNSGRVHIHAPLYPAMLALLYDIFSFRLFWVRLFQSLLVFGGFGLLAWTLKKYIAPGNQTLFYLVLILAAVYPPLLFHSSELISESLLLPLTCGVLTLLVYGDTLPAAGKFSKAAGITAAAGIGAGLMAIAHPASLLFTIAETVMLLICAFRALKKQKKAIRLLIPAVFALGALLPTVPVCAHNSLLAGKFVLIQRNSGFNFYLGNNPEATGTCYVRPGKSWNRLHDRAEAEAGKHGIDKDEYFRSQAFRFILSNPVSECKLLLKKVLYVWNYRELPAGADLSPLLYFTGIVRSGRYLFILLGSLAICGIILISGKRETLSRYRHLLLLTAACWAAQTITVTSGRYRLMMYPAFFTFAAFAIDFLLHNSKNCRRILNWAGALGIGALIVCLPSPPFNPRQEQAEADSITGEAYFHQGKYPQAAAHFHAGLEYDPADVRAFNLLGIISEAESPPDLKAAAEYYRQAIKYAPETPEGYLNLAVQYSQQGKLRQAENYFRNALRYGRHSPAVLYNYACFLLKLKQPEKAGEYLDACLAEAPWHREALNTRGVICLRKRNPQAALKYLYAAYRTAPAKTGVMLNLAVALKQSGNHAAAVEMLRKILSLEPENKTAGYLLKKWEL